MGRTDCTEPQCLYKSALYLSLPSLRLSDLHLYVLFSVLIRATCLAHLVLLI